MTNEFDAWPGGATWVFQGTVAEDATGGTHVCSLTVTPGAGNELQVLYGVVTVGNTATGQTGQVWVDDGANIVGFLLNSNSTQGTTANLAYPFPLVSTTSALGATSEVETTGFPSLFVSGSMRLRLVVTTAAVSVTQTFAVVCRVKGTVPTATLADSVGAPVLTTNTNKVF